MPLKEAIVSVRVVAVLTSIVLCGSAAARAQSATSGPPSQAQGAGRSHAAPTDDWTGLYFGANVGHASATLSGPVTFAGFAASGQTLSAETVTLGPASAGSGTVGVQAGYGIRLARYLVGALEVQFTHGSSAPAPQLVGAQANAPGNIFFIAADSLAVTAGSTTSILVRAGTPMARGVFVYGTVGVAMTSVTATGIFPAIGSFPAAGNSLARTMKGLTIGVGAEVAPFKSPSLRHVTIGAEFRHNSLGTQTFDFGDVDVFQPPPVVEPALGTITVSTNEFDVRVNVRFPMKR
jgi:opacity protein-like surface antigen